MPHEQEGEVFMMPSETSAQRQRILVIDDDFDIREVLRDRLQAVGFAVVAAGSGHHGLALIEDHASKGCQIDGILLNWKMPGSDYSMAALQKLQEEHAEIPVIVMAALSQIERIDWWEDMMRKGARDCILKPLDTNLLWEKCSRHFVPLSHREIVELA
jgi:CheY-like chemotaxis protein